MPTLIINVNKIEELQMTKSLMELEHIMSKAQSVIVQGGTVELQRAHSGKPYIFEKFTTENELALYKEQVFKYL